MIKEKVIQLFFQSRTKKMAVEISKVSSEYLSQNFHLHPVSEDHRYLSLHTVG